MKTLCFEIHPANADWTVSGMEGAAPVDFRDVKFGRFRKIKVNIYAHDPNDPGQLLRMRGQLINLVCMLARLQSVIRDDGVGADKPQSPQILLHHQGDAGWPAVPTGHRLPGIEIEFVDQEATVWGGPEEHSCLLAYGKNDMTHMIRIFEYLRGCLTAKIIVPSRLQGAIKISLDDLMPELQSVPVQMTSTTPFGTGPNDRRIRKYESGRALQFDCELDTLDGPTAATLRLQRFQAWRDYEPTIQALMEMEVAGWQRWLQIRLAMRRECWLAWQRIGDRTTWIPPIGIDDGLNSSCTWSISKGRYDLGSFEDRLEDLEGRMLGRSVEL